MTESSHHQIHQDEQMPAATESSSSSMLSKSESTSASTLAINVPLNDDDVRKCDDDDQCNHHHHQHTSRQIPAQHEHDNNYHHSNYCYYVRQKRSRGRRVCRCILLSDRNLWIGFILAMAVIGTTLLVFFLSPSYDHQNTTNNKSNDNITANEMLQAQDLVQQMLGVNNLVLLEEWDAQASPEAQALYWITHKDPAQLTVHDATFLQRYLAAYFYYSTSQTSSSSSANSPTSWTHCGPPLVAPFTASNRNQTDSLTCTWQSQQFAAPQVSARWLTNATECQWAGISCDNQGQIRSIEMSEFVSLFVPRFIARRLEIIPTDAQVYLFF